MHLAGQISRVPRQESLTRFFISNCTLFMQNLAGGSNDALARRFASTENPNTPSVTYNYFFGNWLAKSFGVLITHIIVFDVSLLPDVAGYQSGELYPGWAVPVGGILPNSLVEACFPLNFILV